MNINTDIILVIKKNPETNLLRALNIAIPTPLKDELGQLKKIYPSHLKQGAEIYSTIAASKTLGAILRPWNYCRDLYGPYGELETSLSKICNTVSNINSSNKIIFEKIMERVRACNLNRHLEELKKDPEIFSYSHRYVGWTHIDNKFGDDFSILHRTNFGYGYSSHFYTIITYKGIDIVPFSNWVIYRQIEKSELIRYSAKHTPDDSCWIQAMKFACDAWNMMVQNKINFINKYIVAECETMVLGIERFLNKHNFEIVSDNNGFYGLPGKKQKSSSFVGYSLDVFIAEKVSGALDFIEKLTQLNDILEVANYIGRIEACNKAMQVRIPEMLPKLAIQVESQQKLVNKLQADYEHKESRKHKKSELDYVYFHQLREEGKYDLKTYETLFNKTYPEYKNADTECTEAWKSFDKMRAELRTSERLLDELHEHHKKINEYFDNKINS